MTRAYFTAATFAVWSYKSLGRVNSKNEGKRKSLPKLFSEGLKMKKECELILWGEEPIRTSRLKGVWGRRLTNKQKEMLVLTKKAKSILLGILLSDGWVQRGKKNWNPRIGIKQSKKNVNYLLNIMNEIGYLYPSRGIMEGKNEMRGKEWENVSIVTRALPSLKEVIGLLYEEKNGKLVRRIKEEMVNSMDEVVLAHWIMGDGSKRNEGIILCTDGFTMKEVVMLMNMLIIRLGINPRIHKEKGRSRIYIEGGELKKIRGRLEENIIKHFKYKLNDLV